ncbi:hypothetical protein [Sporosarcina sp. NPDC096371]|uniref:hypothetical protein n=1 Tax=Sporosarcina sp. NPDC096371 TaxID=3364530 RepID=UPI00381A6817
MDILFNRSVQGVNFNAIIRSVGHEKIETTMIYLKKVFEKERHAIHSWKSKHKKMDESSPFLRVVSHPFFIHISSRLVIYVLQSPSRPQHFSKHE